MTILQNRFLIHKKRLTTPRNRLMTWPLCRLLQLFSVFLLIQFHTRNLLRISWTPNNRLDRFLQVASSIDNIPVGNKATSVFSMINHSTPLTRQQHEQLQQHSKAPHVNAYAFLVAGCDPDDPRYRGFLFNIFLAIYHLWRSGSNAEYVIFVSMAAKSTHHTLPFRDVEIFSKLVVNYNNTQTANKNATAPIIHFKYLPKPKVDSFYHAMMSKFVVLNLTEYRRVLFLDADILPLCNLDYLFEYSERGMLQDNVVMATRTEPSNGGFFLITPHIGDYEQLLAIIQRQQEHAKKNSTHPFDYELGWGHAIQPPDEWVSLNPSKRGQQWLFHGSFADQGLLYHWVKYVKKHVSIILYDVIQHWAPLENNTNDAITDVALQSSSTSTSMPGFGCPTRYSFHPKHRPSPYKDIAHFTGSHKPWERRRVPEVNTTIDPQQYTSSQKVWYHFLHQANRELDLQLNINTILNKAEPLLGRYPKEEDIIASRR